MTIIDKVKDTFSGCAPGEDFTTRQIIEKVQSKYSVNETSIIPSDYCYNLSNKGKEASASLEKFKIFEWVSSGHYIYRGENYPYTGPVHRNPRQK